MQLFLYKKSRKGLLGSSSDASVPDFRFRKSENIPSSNFFEFLTGRPKAWNLKDRHRTMSVPEIWKRVFLSPSQYPARESAMVGGSIAPHRNSPQNTRNIFAGRKKESANVLIRSPVHGSRDEKVFH